MFRKNLAIAVIAGAALLAPVSTLAKETSRRVDYAKPGFYLAAGAGMAIDTEAQDILRALGIPSPKVHNSLSIGVRMGYRAAPYFAMEFDTEYLTGFDTSVSGIQGGEIKAFTMTANARGYLPIGRIQPYALLGIGMMYVNFSDSSGAGLSTSSAAFAIRLGGGLEAYLTENIFLEVGAAYVTPFGDAGGVEFAHATVRGSIGYRF